MSPRLTIVSLNFAPEPTGTAPYTAALASHLHSAGWSVTVLAGTPHYPRWEVEEGYADGDRRDDIDGVAVLHLRHYVPTRPRLMTRIIMEAHFGIRAALSDWNDPDVVLFVTPALFSTGIGMAAARLRHGRARSAVWVQDFYGRGLEESHASASRLASLVQRFEGAVLARGDRAFVIHDRFKQHAIHRLGLSPHKVEVICNWSHIEPCRVQPRDEVRQSFGWADEEIIVLHAGNMGVKQHLENVVEAARIAELAGSSVRFVLLGGGNQRSRLEALGAGITTLQFIDPLPDAEYSMALSAADILLVNEMPGVRDMSLPSKLTSYFSTGRPVLAAVEHDSATACELKASGSGVAIRSGSPETLLRVAESLGTDPVRAAALGENGPHYAREHLSSESAMRRWEAGLTSLQQS